MANGHDQNMAVQALAAQHLTTCVASQVFASPTSTTTLKLASVGGS